MSLLLLWVGLKTRKKAKMQCVGKRDLTNVSQTKVCGQMYKICVWVELQFLSTYKEYLV